MKEGETLRIIERQTDARFVFLRGIRKTVARLSLLCALSHVALGQVALASGANRADLIPVDLQAIARNEQVIVAVGVAGTLITSTDGGESWMRSAINPGGTSLIDISACPDGSFLALDFYNRVWTGNSAADKWEEFPLPPESTPLASTCAPNGDYWVVGTESMIFNSSDFGKSWLTHSFKQDINLTVVQFISKDKLVVVGEFGFLAQSEDGGASWSELPRVPDDFYSFDASFKPSGDGWLVGRAGQILRTNDGGNSWMKEVNPLGDIPMYGLISDPDTGRLFAVGELGRALEHQLGVWKVVGDKVPGGYLRGAILLSGAKSLIAVGGSGPATPVVLDAGESSGHRVHAGTPSKTPSKSSKILQGGIGG